ncbi:unnamed protein product [Moneuplotes crassus]|uniref:Uncharacterized protein n=1 Tax=Euplotes crassus TaxID=5936 RepID=A0AAD1XSG2_EUPCR|nr:unnamed protein product [Moneuplotes crassus]
MEETKGKSYNFQEMFIDIHLKRECLNNYETSMKEQREDGVPHKTYLTNLYYEIRKVLLELVLIIQIARCVCSKSSTLKIIDTYSMSLPSDHKLIEDSIKYMNKKGETTKVVKGLESLNIKLQNKCTWIVERVPEISPENIEDITIASMNGKLAHESEFSNYLAGLSQFTQKRQPLSATLVAEKIIAKQKKTGKCRAACNLYGTAIKIYKSVAFIAFPLLAYFGTNKDNQIFETIIGYFS